MVLRFFRLSRNHEFLAQGMAHGKQLQAGKVCFEEWWWVLVSSTRVNGTSHMVLRQSWSPTNGHQSRQSLRWHRRRPLEDATQGLWWSPASSFASSYQLAEVATGAVVEAPWSVYSYVIVSLLHDLHVLTDKLLLRFEGFRNVGTPSHHLFIAGFSITIQLLEIPHD